MEYLPGNWIDVEELDSNNYVCYYCGNYISSNKGYSSSYFNPNMNSNIYICHHCNRPTFIEYNGEQYPGSIYGNSVSEINSKDVEGLFDESRKSISIGAYTASVLCSRKLLMNLAVSKGAEGNKSFAYYVDYLDNKGYVPPGGKAWVDHIRIKGNEATHEIALLQREDAEELVDFSEMLLKFIYEFPARATKKYNP